ncbi:MAG: OPT/YSL family transporter [Proteobacteria bacterium]|nr:OPT/YSL family transporter [Pseudomonadota bacterium]MBI3496648.1 OPT/YSL family transporter [Pseudomonadota bacterium]
MQQSTGAEHPRFFSFESLALIAPLCVVGAIIGTELITTLGITTNTSLIGALAGMALARVPLALLRRYKSIHVQNLAQSAISAATFGAGNALLLPVGIPFVLGRMDLVGPMLLGVFLAMLLDGYMLYRMFDSEVFPAEGAWPPGVAAAEAIRAGDEGGRKGLVLLGGIGVGILGSIFAIPMSAFGVAFIGNIWALTMFGIGLLTRGYSSTLLPWLAPGGDLMKAYIPHGVMVGAGLVALIQVVMLMLQRDSAKPASSRTGTSAEEVRRTIAFGSGAYVLIAVIIALLGGMISEMSFGMLVLFIVYAAFAALTHELIVGLAAMHAGWFPAFAVALITLVIGMLIGFPAPALCLLVGFSAATGPAFADMGYDLKAGHMLRGYGTDPAFEREGRRQQLYAAMFAFVIAGIVVFISYQGYFAANKVAPVDRVYVATIKAGASWEVAQQLAIWAIPGAIVQFLGGPKRQLGVLFATGLLLLNPTAGWAVLVGVALRTIWTRATSGARQSDMEVFAAGAIAGDALYSFYDTMTRAFLARK